MVHQPSPGPLPSRPGVDQLWPRVLEPDWGQGPASRVLLDSSHRHGRRTSTHAGETRVTEHVEQRIRLAMMSGHLDGWNIPYPGRPTVLVTLTTTPPVPVDPAGERRRVHLRAGAVDAGQATLVSNTHWRQWWVPAHPIPAEVLGRTGDLHIQITAQSVPEPPDPLHLVPTPITPYLDGRDTLLTQPPDDT